MATATKRRAKSKKSSQAGVPRPRVTKEEALKVRAFVQSRKKGVTREEVSTKFKCAYSRARSLLKLAKVKAKPKGEGKENRTLVYVA